MLGVSFRVEADGPRVKVSIGIFGREVATWFEPGAADRFARELGAAAAKAQRNSYAKD